MKTNTPKIQISEFVDLVALPSKSLSYQIFDLIIEDEININNYCAALIDKVCILNNTSYSNFIDYQCLQVQNPILFLEKFQELITNNEKVFRTKCINLKMSYLFDLLDKKHKELQSTTVKKSKNKIQDKYINAKSEHRIFCFQNLLIQVDNCKTDKEKIILLTNEKHEYKRANKTKINKNLELYDLLCVQEIDQIKELSNLKAEEELAKAHQLNSNLVFPKLKINCNLNQIVDVFHYLSTKEFEKGKPYIEGSLADLKAAIITIFKDKDSNDLSPQTVETILKPSRDDKRPKDYKRIDLDKLL